MARRNDFDDTQVELDLWGMSEPDADRKVEHAKSIPIPSRPVAGGQLAFDFS